MVIKFQILQILPISLKKVVVSWNTNFNFFMSNLLDLD